MQRRYLPLHKVAQLADPSAKQTGIAYRHLFSFLPGLLLSFFVAFLQLFSFLLLFCFLSLCCLLACVSCFVFLGGFLLFSAQHKIVIATTTLPVGTAAPCYVWIGIFGTCACVRGYAVLLNTSLCVWRHLPGFYFCNMSAAYSCAVFLKELLCNFSDNRFFFLSRCNFGFPATMFGCMISSCACLCIWLKKKKNCIIVATNERDSWWTWTDFC